MKKALLITVKWIVSFVGAVFVVEYTVWFIRKDHYINQDTRERMTFRESRKAAQARNRERWP